jgi:hypothetical protein
VWTRTVTRHDCTGECECKGQKETRQRVEVSEARDERHKSSFEPCPGTFRRDKALPLHFVSESGTRDHLASSFGLASTVGVAPLVWSYTLGWTHFMKDKTAFLTLFLRLPSSIEALDLREVGKSSRRGSVLLTAIKKAARSAEKVWSSQLMQICGA